MNEQKSNPEANGQISAVGKPDYKKMNAIAIFNAIGSLGVALMQDVKGSLFPAAATLADGKEVVAEAVVELPDLQGAIKCYLMKMSVSMEEFQMTPAERMQMALDQAAAAAAALPTRPEIIH